MSLQKILKECNCHTNVQKKKKTCRPADCKQGDVYSSDFMKYNDLKTKVK